MKNSFKKIALLSTALMTSMSTFAISSGGIAAATLGAAAGVALIGYGIHKSHQHHSDKKSQRSSSSGYASKTKIKNEKHALTRAERRDLKHQINDLTKTIKNHTVELKKLEKKGKRNTPEAQKHKSIIAKLESEKSSLITKLHNL